MNAPKSIRVISVGDCCVDWYSGDREAAYVGGNAANTAVYLARQGIPTWFMGVVGNDQAGQYIRDALKEEGIHLEYLAAKRGKTGLCEIRVDQGERHFISENLGVSSPFVVSDEMLDILSGFGLVHIPGFFSWIGGARNHQPGLKNEFQKLTGSIKLSVDFSESTEAEVYFEEVGAYLDFSFFSRPQLSTEEVEEFVCRSLRFTNGLVIVTRGHKGSAAAGGDGIIHQCPTERVRVVDTLGAGDSFIAGFLAHYLIGGDIARALQAGTTMAATVIQQEGAWSNRVIEICCRKIKLG